MNCFREIIVTSQVNNFLEIKRTLFNFTTIVTLPKLLIETFTKKNTKQETYQTRYSKHNYFAHIFLHTSYSLICYNHKGWVGTQEMNIVVNSLLHHED